MGHESQIEPWLAHDQRSACWFHKSLASSRNRVMKTAGRKPTNATRLSAASRSFGADSENKSCSITSGAGNPQNPAEGEAFFVDFPLIELCRHFRIISGLPVALERSVDTRDVLPSTDLSQLGFNSWEVILLDRLRRYECFTYHGSRRTKRSA
jgi:hypothetical protein